MHDDGGAWRDRGGTVGTAEDLLGRIDEITREIDRVREERAAEPVRAARMRLARAHRVKRLVQELKGAPQNTAG
jgi:hypothetical protein